MFVSLHIAFRQHIRRQSNALIRHNSTTTSPSYLIPTWNDYFQLRSKRRQLEVLSYVPSTILPAAITGSYFMAMQIDPTSAIFGMDPFLAAGLATASAGFCGFLAGPIFGDMVFKLLNQRYVTAMDARDKTFYEHIKKNRADARLNSIRNPVPDYYGEKIQSVGDYRSWLRKQREHHRKGVFGGSADDLES